MYISIILYMLNNNHTELSSKKCRQITLPQAVSSDTFGRHARCERWCGDVQSVAETPLAGKAITRFKGSEAKW